MKADPQAVVHLQSSFQRHAIQRDDVDYQSSPCPGHFRGHAAAQADEGFSASQLLSRRHSGRMPFSKRSFDSKVRGREKQIRLLSIHIDCQPTQLPGFQCPYVLHNTRGHAFQACHRWTPSISSLPPSVFLALNNQRPARCVTLPRLQRRRRPEPPEKGLGDLRAKQDQRVIAVGFRGKKRGVGRLRSRGQNPPEKSSSQPVLKLTPYCR